MSNRFVILVIILVVAAIGLVYYLVPFDDPSVIVENESNGSVAGEESFVPGKIIADHFFDNGRHTLTGVIGLPTPCHTLLTDALVAESMPEQVTIAFTSEAGEGICTQVIDEKFFSVSFEASRLATMKATFNGIPVELVISEQGDSVQKL